MAGSLVRLGRHKCKRRMISPCCFRKMKVHPGMLMKTKESVDCRWSKVCRGGSAGMMVALCSYVKMKVHPGMLMKTKKPVNCRW